MGRSRWRLREAEVGLESRRRLVVVVLATVVGRRGCSAFRPGVNL